jgi:hypothetical protein
MTDQKCIEACEAAYASGVRRCNDVLMDCLAIATSEAQKQQCKESFKRCMELCKEAREACLETCNS